MFGNSEQEKTNTPLKARPSRKKHTKKSKPLNLPASCLVSPEDDNDKENILQPRVKIPKPDLDPLFEPDESDDKFDHTMEISPVKLSNKSKIISSRICAKKSARLVIHLDNFNLAGKLPKSDKLKLYHKVDNNVSQQLANSVHICDINLASATGNSVFTASLYQDITAIPKSEIKLAAKISPKQLMQTPSPDQPFKMVNQTVSILDLQNNSLQQRANPRSFFANRGANALQQDHNLPCEQPHELSHIIQAFQSKHDQDSDKIITVAPKFINSLRLILLESPATLRTIRGQEFEYHCQADLKVVNGVYTHSEAMQHVRWTSEQGETLNFSLYNRDEIASLGDKPAAIVKKIADIIWQQFSPCDLNEEPPPMQLHFKPLTFC